MTSIFAKTAQPKKYVVTGPIIQYTDTATSGPATSGPSTVPAQTAIPKTTYVPSPIVAPVLGSKWDPKAEAKTYTPPTLIAQQPTHGGPIGQPRQPGASNLPVVTLGQVTPKMEVPQSGRPGGYPKQPAGSMRFELDMGSGGGAGLQFRPQALPLSIAEYYYPGDENSNRAVANLRDALARAKERRALRAERRASFLEGKEAYSPYAKQESATEDVEEAKGLLDALGGKSYGSPGWNWSIPSTTTVKPIGSPAVVSEEEAAVVQMMKEQGITLDDLAKLGLSPADLRIEENKAHPNGDTYTALVAKESGLELSDIGRMVPWDASLQKPKETTVTEPVIEAAVTAAETSSSGGGGSGGSSGGGDYYGGGGGYDSYGGGGGSGGGELGEDKWKTAYSISSAPSFWSGLVPAGEMTPEKEYATLMNALIPFMSPEDQRTTASTLAIMFPDIFGKYSAVSAKFGEIPMPGGFLSSDYMRRFFSRKNARNLIGALQKVAGAAGGAKEFGPGYHYLLQIASALRDFGGRKGELPSRAQIQQLRGALDPLIAMTGNQTLSAYGPLVNALTQPFYSAGEVMPISRLPDGSYQFGKANTELF